MSATLGQKAIIDAAIAVYLANEHPDERGSLACLAEALPKLAMALRETPSEAMEYALFPDRYQGVNHIASEVMRAYLVRKQRAEQKEAREERKQASMREFEQAMERLNTPELELGVQA